MNWHIWLPLAIAAFLGVLWRLFARATKAYRSPLRSYPSRWSFVVCNWDVFLLRTVPFNSGLWVLWVWKPGLLSVCLTHVGVPAGFANWLAVTPTLGSSWCFGFLVDYALDQVQMRLAKINLPSWVPDAIRGEIPQYDQAAVNGNIVVQANKRDIGPSPEKTTGNG